MNEHSSVMLIAAAIMRVTLPIIVSTLRNGRHQWNGMTQLASVYELQYQAG